MAIKYDAIVIGSGQGGNPLAHKLADKGWRVALVEKSHLGGTCINTGCTPTKTMMASAQVAHYARQAARWGVHAGNVTVDLNAVVARKDEVVEKFRGGQQRRVDERASLDLYRAAARFLSPRRLQAGEDILESDRIFVDTGTRPSLPKIPGLEKSGYLTNVSIMELRDVPRHLVVLGGGYVGLEFGQMFRRFGSGVTIVHHSGQILPREDGEIARALQQALEAEGIRFRLNAQAASVDAASDGIVLSFDGASPVAGTHLLVATGRVPNTDELSLDKAGVELDRRGFIRVNGRLETNVPGIWALGDVKGGPAFTHISYNDYQILWANLIDGKDESIEGRLVPYAVFTDPQLGGVGLTEKEARAQGKRLKIGRTPMSSVARAIERGETAGLMKIVVDADTDRVLGASILGAEGGELVQILAVLMRAKLPYTELKGAVYIHPTLAEGFFSLMEDVRPVS